MGSLTLRSKGRLAIVALLSTPACNADPPPLSIEQRGEALFTTETFDGNGRVCSTCHVLGEFGTITPAFVQARYRENPGDPLFRAIDSDDGTGDSYARLMEHATIRVPMELQTDEATGLTVRRCDAPSQDTVFLHRGNPSVFNVALEELLMVDGRDGADLNLQAANAVTTHNEPGRQPTAEELEAIASFQRSLFSHGAIRGFLEQQAALGLPDGTTPSERRGRRFFNTDEKCGVCHSGPMLNRTSPDHDILVGARFESVLVGTEPDNPNPKYEWCFVDPETHQIIPGPRWRNPRIRAARVGSRPRPPTGLPDVHRTRRDPGNGHQRRARPGRGPVVQDP